MSKRRLMDKSLEKSTPERGTLVDCVYCGKRHRNGSQAQMKCMATTIASPDFDSNKLEWQPAKNTKVEEVEQDNPAKVEADRNSDAYEVWLIKQIRAAKVKRSDLAQRSRNLEGMGRARYYIKLAASRMNMAQWRHSVCKRQRQLTLQMERARS